MSRPIPVICDRCRAEGLAGTGDFAALGDLLDFEPVQLQVDRVDGWNPQCQRAYIAALAVLGSAYRAARAIGKSATGAERLRRLPGAEGFIRAWEKAVAIAREQGTLRLADSLRAVAEPPPPPAPAPEAPPEPTPGEEAKQLEEAMLWLERILRLYLIKLDQERESRREGDISAADLYIRQITCLEVVLDLISVDCRVDPVQLIRDCHRGDSHLVEIAETPLSRLLDEARRAHWRRCGEPPRPEPPRHLYEPYHGVTIQPGAHASSGKELGIDEQWRWWNEQHARDAEAHIEWEAEALRDFERRRDISDAQDQEPGSAGTSPPDEGDR